MTYVHPSGTVAVYHCDIEKRHESGRRLWAGAVSTPTSWVLMRPQHNVAIIMSVMGAQHDDVWERRDVLGVHPQKQEGYSWVGACVPAGRIFPEDLYAFADVCEKCAPCPPCRGLPLACVPPQHRIVCSGDMYWSRTSCCGLWPSRCACGAAVPALAEVGACS